MTRRLIATYAGCSNLDLHCRHSIQGPWLSPLATASRIKKAIYGETQRDYRSYLRIQANRSQSAARPIKTIRVRRVVQEFEARHRGTISSSPSHNTTYQTSRRHVRRERKGTVALVGVGGRHGGSWLLVCEHETSRDDDRPSGSCLERGIEIDSRVFSVALRLGL